jgi:hypothetical protein
MTFDNERFKSEALKTKLSLDNVDKAVSSAGKNKGLLNLGKDMEGLVGKSKTMQIAAVTAIGTITNKLVNMGLQTGKSLLLDPIKQGFNEYGELLTTQNAIMNATGKSAETVKKTLNTLNEYSDTTIFKFSDMTGALTKFSNAGIGLKKSEKLIKGVGNASAFAGLTTEKAGAAFYAIGQTMETGFLSGNDLMQLNNAGFATVKFKEEVVKAAASLGNLKKSGKGYVTSTGKYVSATKGFKDNLKDQWASAEAVSIALSKYSDSSTKFGKKAFAAAQEVRTFSAFMGTLKESLGSGWAQVFGAMFGGLKEATSMWTGLSLAVSGVTSKFFSFLAASLQVWRDMGGAAKIGQAIKNVFAPIVAIFSALGEAWKTAFGGEGGKGAGSTLYAISYGLELLTRPLAWLAKLIGLIVHPLTLFFSILRLGGQIIGYGIDKLVDFVKSIVDLASFKMPSGGGGGTLLGWLKTLISEVQRAVGVVSSLLEEGKSIKEAFSALGDIDLKLPKLPKLGGFSLGNPFGNLFGGGEGDEAATQLETVNTQFMELANSARTLGGGINLRELEQGFTDFAASAEGGVVNVKEFAGAMDGYFTPAIENAASSGGGFFDWIGKVASAIGDFFGKIKGEDIAASLNFAVLATMGITFAQMMRSIAKGFDIVRDIAGSIDGIFQSIGSAIDEFADAKKRESQARLIMTIAIAIGILAISLFVLSRIPQDKMIVAFQGLAAAIAGLGIVMFIMSKALAKIPDGSSGKMIAMGAAMVLMGIGLLGLALAMKVMATVGLDGVLKSLLTLAVIFRGLEMVGNTAAKSGRTMLAAAAAMVIIGGALIVLATALLMFKLVDYGSMAKAGLSLLALTAALFILTKVPPPMMLAAGAAMLAIATAMSILVVALLAFALVKWESIAKAAVVLLALSIALLIVSAGGPTGAAAIVALAAAVMILALAMVVLQKINWSTIAKAAVVLVILVAAFAAFMLVVYLAAPAIALLTGLALGLAALAVGIALLVGALAIILPLLAASVAVFAAFATGAAIAIAVFLQTLALEAGNMKKSILTILQVFIDAIVEAVPMVIDGIKRLIQAIWDQFTKPGTGDKMKAGGKSMMDKLMDQVKEWAPKIGKLIVELVQRLADTIIENREKIVTAGIKLVISLIDALASQAQPLIDAGVNLITEILRGLGRASQDLMDAGVKLLIDFVNGMADALLNNAEGMGDAINRLVDGMVKLGEQMAAGLARGLGGAARGAITSPWSLGKNFVKGFLDGANDEAEVRSPSKKTRKLGHFLVDGLTLGVQDRTAAAIAAIAAVVSGQIATANEYISKYVQQLDQKSIAARAQAEGLAEAAQRASDAASKTEKNKKDDAAAERLSKQSEKLAERADKAEEKAEKAREAENRKAEFQAAATIDKARMRTEDAQRQIDEAKAAEARAAKDVAQAKALEKAAKSGTYSKAESDKFRKEAEKLRKDAAVQLKLMNSYLAGAKISAGDALRLQQLAGAEAAKAFQEQFDAQAKEDADQDAYDALTDSEKAAKRRADAAVLQADAAKNLIEAKKLAYTDLEAANALAEVAMEQADRAREYVREAEDLEKAVADAAKDAADKLAEEEKKKAEEKKEVNIPITGTTSIDLTASDAAAAAFAAYSDQYSDAAAAAAAPTHVEFTQYNQSPESLSPTEIYRQTNNLLTAASDKLAKAA